MEQLSYEKVSENESFDCFKIRKSSKREEFILTAIFKVKKVNKAIIELLNKTVTEYNKLATGLFLDVSVVDSIAPDILEYNADMIKNLENTSKFRSVTICAGRLMIVPFKALMAIKQPKIPTKFFEKEEDALSFSLELKLKK